MSQNGYQQWLTDPHARRKNDRPATVTVRREAYDELLRQAAAWRDLSAEIGSADELLGLLIEAPGVREILMQEYAAWVGRQQLAESSHAISGARTWKGEPSHADLVRRRMQPGKLHQEFTERRGEYTGGPVEWATGRPAGEQQPPAAA